MHIKSVVVFCGARQGFDPVYQNTAYELGATLAEQNFRLVYGGSKLGIMGALAEGALQHKGHVTGVIPNFLKTKEVVHAGLSSLVMTETMHERKLKMHELSDAIIAMPGGWGTMEELFEMMTWAQLGLHAKPIAILNVNGFYEPLMALINVMTEEGFLSEVLRNMLIITPDISELLDRLKTFEPPALPQLITEGKT